MKKHRSIILSIFITALILPIAGCDMAGNESNDNGDTDGYEIGDTGPAGGLIFYIDEAEAYDWTYLEVAPASTEWELKEWGKAGISVTGTSNAIGAGSDNTLAIIDILNSGTPHYGKPPQLCDELSHNGYEDWFLPSRAELEAIWENLVDNGAGENNGVGGFSEEIYWSSSQRDSMSAYGLRFNGSPLSYYSKSELLSVRAIRAF